MSDQHSQWTPLEHSIFRKFSDRQLQGKSCLIALSGGSDSVALLHVMSRIAPALGISLSAAHVHHGPTHSEQLKYRDHALSFVQDLCQQLSVPLQISKSETELTSEADLRDFRHGEIEAQMKHSKSEFSVWAHHQDDFLETQLMRLIRGTGETGMTPMSFSRGALLRPFLQTPKQEIKDYLTERKISFLEDPSNLQTEPLRNWIRQSWLPQLEEKCPGALKSFARSLDLLQAKDPGPEFEHLWLESNSSGLRSVLLSRPVFLTLSPAQKKQGLAISLRRLGHIQFTQNQLLEVMKRLDRPQIVQQFSCMKLVWSLSKDVISVTPPFVVNEK